MSKEQVRHNGDRKIGGDSRQSKNSEEGERNSGCREGGDERKKNLRSGQNLYRKLGLWI